MTLYLAEVHEAYEDSYLLGIFDDLKKAQKAARDSGWIRRPRRWDPTEFVEGKEFVWYDGNPRQAVRTITIKVVTVNQVQKV